MARLKCCVPVLLCAVGGLLAFIAAPALAAGPPEAPETTGSKSVTATTAVLEGVLNPHAAVATKAGWYFAYTTEPVCIPSLTSPLEGEEEVKAKPEHVEVTNLEPNKEYTFCMVATSEEGAQATTSATDLKFKTDPAKPTVESEGASAVDATAGTLEAQVNPNNEATSFKFEYSTEGKVGAGEALEGSIKTLDGAADLPAEYGPRTATVPRLEGLPPGTTYYYRVVAKNLTGTATGQVRSFTTVAAPVTDPVTAIGETTATFNGHLTPLNPNAAAQYHFDYKLGGGECAGESETPSAEAGEGPGGAASESTPVTGLSPDRVYTVCLVTSNAFGSEQGPPVTFRTLAEAYTTEVTSNSVVLHAVIDPEGSSTTYSFEYGPSIEYGSETPVESAGSGSEAATFKYALQHLEPGTYHYRVLVTHAGNTTQGEDHTFTTQTAGQEFSMLDNRAWELVTPQEKDGSSIQPISYKGGVVQAAEDGEAMTYDVSGPFGENPEANVAPGQSQILSTRSPGVGWSSKDIAAPHALGRIPEGEGFEYRDFSSNLEDAILQPQGQTLLPAPTKSTPQEQTPQEQTLYLRQNGSGATNPLINELNIRQGAHLGTVANGANEVEFDYASPDLHHVLFDSTEALAPAEAPGTEPAGGHGFKNVYEWSGEPGQLGTVQLVSLLPKGETSTESGSFPGHEHSPFFVARDAMSSDGSRVAWTGEGAKGLDGGVEGLYVTDMAKHESVLVASPGSEGAVPYFQGANAEGTRIFFTDKEALTPGADPSRLGEEGDLYVFEVPRSAGPLAGTLRDLTLDTREDGNVLGRCLIGYGAEGSGASESMTLYFVDDGVLAENKGAAGGIAVNGGQNLYVERLVGGVWQAPSFIASLSLADARSWGGEGNTGEQNQRSLFPEMSSRVSGSGRFLAFMSSEPLTGYDNRDVSSGVRDEEVFLYDSQSGKLSCASCDPSGARPHGILDFGVGMLADEQHDWLHHWLAASVPGWTPNLNGDLSTYQSRYLSDSGRLFFDAADGLVPGDVNGREDVYEFEPEGVGSCTSGVHGQGSVFSPAADGCVGLISSGTSPEESAFLDASGVGGNGEEAEDVFFLTSSQLVGGDRDGAIDVYDAHECSTKVPCPSGAGDVPPACSDADSCRAAPAPQPSLYGAPSSATFAGSGNPTPVVARPVEKKKAVKCKRGFTKNKKGKCVRKKSKKQAKRAGHNGRTKS